MNPKTCFILAILVCGCIQEQTPKTTTTTTTSSSTSSTTTTTSSTTTSTTLERLLVCDREFERDESVVSNCKNMLSMTEFTRNETATVTYALITPTVRNISSTLAQVNEGDCEYEGSVKTRYTGYMSCNTPIDRLKIKPRIETMQDKKGEPEKKNIYALPECNDKAALVDEWGIYCADNYAITQDDPNLCASNYCIAYITGDKNVCKDKDQLCAALSERDYGKCKDIYQREDCMIEYSYFTNDIELCKRTYGKLSETVCYGIWAFQRGDTTYCKNFRKSQDIKECEARYFSSIAYEKSDEEICNNIELPGNRNGCITSVRAGYTHETNPLKILVEHQKITNNNTR